MTVSDEVLESLRGCPLAVNERGWPDIERVVMPDISVFWPDVLILDALIR